MLLLRFALGPEGWHRDQHEGLKKGEMGPWHLGEGAGFLGCSVISHIRGGQDA